jgi:hypothetical protein
MFLSKLRKQGWFLRVITLLLNGVDGVSKAKSSLKAWPIALAMVKHTVNEGILSLGGFLSMRPPNATP